MPYALLARWEGVGNAMNLLPIVLLGPWLGLSMAYETGQNFQDYASPSVLVASAQQYFQSKHVENVVCFSCRQSGDRKFLQTASAAGIQTRVVKMDQTDDISTIRVRSGYTRVGIFLDSSCSITFSVLAQASDLSMFNASYHWFLWSPTSQHKKRLLRALGRAYLAVNTEMLLSWPSENETDSEDYVQFWDVYKLHYTGELRLASTGKHSGLDWGSNTLERRKNLTGHVVLAVSIVMRNMKPGWDQEAEFLDERRGPQDPNIYQRESVAILAVLKELYNFTYRLRTVSVGGSYLRNGSCTVMSGLLQRGEADYGVFLRMELDRWNCMDYVFDTYKFFEIVMVHRLPPASSTTTGMVRPLSGAAWLALGGTALLLAALLWLAEAEADSKAGSILLLTVAAVANTSVDLDLLSPRPSVRSAYFIAVLGFFMLAAFYSSAIISALVVFDTRGGMPVRGIIQDGFRIIAEDYALYRVFFRNYTNDPFLKELARRFLVPSAYVKLGPALQMVRAGRVALITDKNTVVLQLAGKVMAESELCSLRYTRINDKFLLQAVSRKNWPLRDLMARGLALVRERGVGRRISPIIVPPCTGPDADAYNGKEVSQLPVAACSVAFAILVVGMSATTVLFLAELCVGVLRPSWALRLRRGEK